MHIISPAESMVGRTGNVDHLLMGQQAVSFPHPLDRSRNALREFYIQLTILLLQTQNLWASSHKFLQFKVA
jgi:hypothetical protein